MFLSSFFWLAFFLFLFLTSRSAFLSTFYHYTLHTIHTITIPPAYLSTHYHYTPGIIFTLYHYTSCTHYSHTIPNTTYTIYLSLIPLITASRPRLYHRIMYFSIWASVFFLVLFLLLALICFASSCIYLGFGYSRALRILPNDNISSLELMCGSKRSKLESDFFNNNYNTRHYHTFSSAIPLTYRP